MTKKKVLVVGAFKKTQGDDRIGGLAFACSSLINSELSNRYEFLLVDSTINSIRSRSGWRRAPSAAYRILKCVWLMLTNRLHCVVCFASHGNSFLEKGVITILGRCLRKRVILFPRSGHLVKQVEDRAWMRWFARRAIGASWRVFCQSETWREFFRRLSNSKEGRVAEDKFRIVENWLPKNSFTDRSTPVASSNGNAFVVGFYNRIEKSKGIDEFIAAIELARETNASVRGVVFGDGVEAERVQNVAEELGEQVLQYNGWLDEGKKSELREVDMVLFCSHAEGFPNSLLEILAQKIPCVATNVGAVADVIVDGESGILVEVGDVQAMANGVLQLAENHRQREHFAEAAFTRVRQQNTLAAAVQKFDEVLA